MKLSPEFMQLQKYAHGQFDSLPIIQSYKSNDDLIRLLQESCTAYCKKLISISDLYQKKANQQTDLQTILECCCISQPQRNSTEAIVRHVSQMQEENTRLQGKIEYLSQQLEESILESRLMQQEDAQFGRSEVAMLRLTIERLNTDKQVMKNTLKELRVAIDQLVHVQMNSLDSTTQEPQFPIEDMNTEVEEMRSKVMLATKELEFQHEVINQRQRNTQAEVQRRESELQQELNRSHQKNEEYKRQNEKQEHEYSNQNDHSKQIAVEVDDFIESLYKYAQDKQNRIQQCLNSIGQFSKLAKRDNDGIVKNMYDQLYLIADQEDMFQRMKKLKLIIKQDQQSEISSIKSNGLKSLGFKERLILDQTELKQKIKQSINQLEQVRQEEEMALLDKEMARSDQLEKINAKLSVQTIYIRINLIVREGLNRTTYILDDLLQLADSGEARNLLLEARQETLNVGKSIEQQDFENEMIQSRILEDEYLKQKHLWMLLVGETKERAAQQESNLMQAITQEHIRVQELEVEVVRLEQQVMALHQRLSEELDKPDERVLIYQNEAQVQVHQRDETIEHLKCQIESLNRQIVGQMVNTEHFESEIARHKQECGMLRQECGMLRQKLDQNSKDTLYRLQEEQRQKQELIEVYAEQVEKLEMECRQNQQAEMHKSLGINQIKRQWDEQNQIYMRDMQQVNQSEKENKQVILNLQAKLDQNKQQFLMQLKIKDSEITQLNRSLLELEAFSRKQLDLIREQENKLNEAYQYNKNFEQDVEANENQMRQMQQKIQKQLEIIQRGTAEIHDLRKDLDRITQNYNQLSMQFEERNQGLNLEDLQDRMRRKNEIINILRDENKNLRSQVEQQREQPKNLLMEENQQMVDLERNLDFSQREVFRLRQEIEKLENLNDTITSHLYMKEQHINKKNEHVDENNINQHPKQFKESQSDDKDQQTITYFSGKKHRIDQ